MLGSFCWGCGGVCVWWGYVFVLLFVIYHSCLYKWCVEGVGFIRIFVLILSLFYMCTKFEKWQTRQLWLCLCVSLSWLGRFPYIFPFIFVSVFYVFIQFPFFIFFYIQFNLNMHSVLSSKKVILKVHDLMEKGEKKEQMAN